MDTTFKVAAGTFLGIALAYGADKGCSYVASGVKHERQDSAIEWMDDITPDRLAKACGKPARDLVSDFGTDFSETYREMYYRGGLPDITWCFRFTKFKDDSDHLGWNIDSFYHGPAPSDLQAISTINVGGSLDPDVNTDLFDTIRPGDMDPSRRNRMIGAMPCLSKIEWEADGHRQSTS